jgi:hypothetical protein
MKLKIRICLICDKRFLTYGPNHVCRQCHKKYEKLFQSAPVGQWEDLIYIVSPSKEGDIPSPTEGEGSG